MPATLSFIGFGMEGESVCVGEVPEKSVQSCVMGQMGQGTKTGFSFLYLYHFSLTMTNIISAWGTQILMQTLPTQVVFMRKCELLRHTFH